MPCAALSPPPPDPPPTAAAVDGCRPTPFPVLAAPAARQMSSSAPIILYATGGGPERAGDFCDATEDRRIIALRVLTLTDDEKAERVAPMPGRRR